MRFPLAGLSVMLGVVLWQGLPAPGAAGTAAYGAVHAAPRAAPVAPASTRAHASLAPAAVPTAATTLTAAPAPAPSATAPAPVLLAASRTSRSGHRGPRVPVRTVREPVPTATGARAGSLQGEGRTRPGRPDSAGPDPFAGDGVPVYTDHDPQRGRRPAGDGRRVDGDRAREAAEAAEGRGTATHAGRGTATRGPDTHASGSHEPRTRPSGTHPSGTHPPGTHRPGTKADRKGAGVNRKGAGVSGDVPDAWRAHSARNARGPVAPDARPGAPQAAPGTGFRPLPFGSGLVLIGLGIGFLGIRLRRT